MFDEPEGATPIDADEASELLPAHIQTREELNVWEQENILTAAKWAGRTRKYALAEDFIRELHRMMFDETWRWAGQFRRSDKNIGVHWETIPAEVRNLVDDGSYWLEHAVYSIDEAALRLHHRLVKIHPFPNGNGRHARLWCDTLLHQNGRPEFRWSKGDLNREGEDRLVYIRALRAADDHNYEPLFRLYLKDRVE